MTVLSVLGKPTAITEGGKYIELTEDEYAFYKAVKRLEKYTKKQGRLELVGKGGLNGGLSIRLIPGSPEDEIDSVAEIYCKGGDGSD
jgi:hypothetical protein